LFRFDAVQVEDLAENGSEGQLQVKWTQIAIPDTTRDSGGREPFLAEGTDAPQTRESIRPGPDAPGIQVSERQPVGRENPGLA